MKQTRISLLLTLVGALLAGGIRAAEDHELSPKTVTWEGSESSGRESDLVGLMARSFFFGSAPDVPFGTPYTVVDIRNLTDAERHLDVDADERAVRRHVTISPHGSVHLVLPTPINGANGYGIQVTIHEVIDGTPRKWRMKTCGYRDYHQDANSAFALVTPSFSREKLAESLGEQTRAATKQGKPTTTTVPYGISTIRFGFPLEELPADWRAYTTFDAVFLTPAEHAALTPDVKDALEGYQAHGGLVFVVTPSANGGLNGGGNDLRKKIAQRKARRINTYEVYVPYRYRTYRYGGNGDITLKDLLEGIPLGDVEPVPVGLILTILAVFCLAVIPIVIVKAFRANRRLSLFATIPATAVIISVLIIAAIFFSVGLTPTVRVQSVTRLNQATKTAATRGAFGIRSPRDADGRITVDGDAAFGCLPKADGVHTTLTDRYRLDDGWVSPLLPVYFSFEKYGRCSAKLAVSVGSDGTVTVANLLGAPVERATLRLDGRLYAFGRIAPGAKATAAASPCRPGTSPAFTYEALVCPATGYGISWSKLVKLADETDRLNDGMYVAHLEGCPFLSAPFGEREVKGSSAAIVIGDFSGEELK